MKVKGVNIVKVQIFAPYELYASRLFCVFINLQIIDRIKNIFCTLIIKNKESTSLAHLPKNNKIDGILLRKEVMRYAKW